MQNKKISGFSIIELLVVITIMGTLATVAAPTLSNDVRKSQYKSDENQITSLISDARTFAIASKQCALGTSAGIWKIEIYPANVLKLSCISTDDTGTPEAPIGINTFTLREGFELTIIETTTSTGTVTPTSIAFHPRTAQVEIEDFTETFTLQLKADEIEKCTKFSIERLKGFIEIDQVEDHTTCT